MFTAWGANYILNTWFQGGTPTTTWYIGLMTDVVTIRPSDTFLSKDWAEFTGYTHDGASHLRMLARWNARVKNDAGAHWYGTAKANQPAAGVTNTTTLTTVTFSEYGVIGGMFITDAASKGGTSGNILVIRSFISSPAGAGISQYGDGPLVAFPGMTWWSVGFNVIIGSWERFQPPEM